MTKIINDSPITMPLSVRSIFEIDKMFRPSTVVDASILFNRLPGKISDLFPSIVQKRVGTGKPVAWHSKITSEPISPNWDFGRITNCGGARKNRRNYFNRCLFKNLFDFLNTYHKLLTFQMKIPFPQHCRLRNNILHLEWDLY